MHKCADCGENCNCKEFLMEEFNQFEEDYDCIGCEGHTLGFDEKPMDAALRNDIERAWLSSDYGDNTLKYA